MEKPEITPERQLGLDRLEIVAKFLDTLPRKKFNIRSWVTKYDEENNCGTVCCAAGWLPKIFPDDWEYKGFETKLPRLKSIGNSSIIYDAILFYDDLKLFFNITNLEKTYLFYANKLTNNLKETATPKIVAKHIRKFIKNNGIYN